MKAIKCTLLLATLALLCGCASSFNLPAVTGKSLEYRRTDPLGGTSISAENVQVTEESVKADSVTWTTQYPQFSISLVVKGYERKRK